MPDTLIQVVLPEMGESVSEGSITGWRKSVGDRVEAGDPLVDVTTDKVDVEVPAPAAGILVRIIAEEGATVRVGAPLAEINTSGPVDKKSPGAVDDGAVDDGAVDDGAVDLHGRSSAVDKQSPGAVDDGAVDLHGRPAAADHASPIAKRRAYLQSIDPAVTTPVAPPSPPPPSDATLTPLKGPAATLAGYMEQSLTIPTATSFRTIAVDVMDERRRQLNRALKSDGRAEKVSFTHLIAFAIARAAKDVPSMAASFRRGEKGPERVTRGIHLGLAVDTQRKDGSRFLIVPVIRSPETLGFKAFHTAYEALVAKARAGSLTPEDISGATITLTNPGGIGTIASVPRLMPGQGTIVAAGAIDYPPGFASAAETSLKTIGVSKVMTLTSTYDHRVIQGAESGEFLRRIDQLLSGTDRFYDSVFEDFGLAAAPVVAGAVAPVDHEVRPLHDAIPNPELLRAAAAGAALVSRYRTHGHIRANLDPLNGQTTHDPALDPSTLGLTPELMAAVPATVLRVYAPGENLGEVLERLRTTYCGTIAYEVEHISNHEQRSWLRKQIESGAHLDPVSKERRLQLLDRLTRVEAFERYLRKAFLGQKTFSIEGLDAMVPMLEELLDIFADEGVAEVDLGMAHRGRLAIITHVVDRPYEEVLREFEQADARGVQGEGDVTGDVKYHQGARGSYRTDDGTQIRVSLANNPSHLEAVNGVVEGRTRAAQTDRTANIATLHVKRALAVLIHGDAAFSAQGSVAETLNLSALAGYTTGGTIHIIANNQIGFTTTPAEGRSTRYASDMAKGFDLPIVHVNADDVEACIGAIRLAAAYRKQFSRDVLIDLIGYRRFGHNEADEPAYTQPTMYAAIAKHPTVRDLFARKLLAQGVITDSDAASRFEAASKRVAEAHANAKTEVKVARSVEPRKRAPNGAPAAAVETRVAADVIKRLNDELLAEPPGFTIHPKLVRQLDRRRSAMAPGGDIDWAHGEALAFGSLLLEGRAVRLTGQDTERGTFSHRHIVLHDAKTGIPWTPIEHLTNAKASIEVHNSPLSEYACLGYEYGYSAAAPDVLVLWEAQFGDFANGAQVIIDQFVSAGFAKWEETSRLTLLLPHGYEGAGPEHSSARLERFLQLAADNNFRIANCTTPAQYFHLLRNQALSARARPLIVMTPKSLLRLKAASSHLSDFTERGFASVLDDASVADRSVIERLIFCTGKIFYDLTLHPARATAGDLSIARVELLEPFPLASMLAVVNSYPKLRRVTWVQEEPRNMGARAFVSRRIRERLTAKGIVFDYVGRPDRASPSEGYPGSHAAEQERIVITALSAPKLEEAR